MWRNINREGSWNYNPGGKFNTCREGAYNSPRRLREKTHQYLQAITTRDEKGIPYREGKSNTDLGGSLGWPTGSYDEKVPGMFVE